METIHVVYGTPWSGKTARAHTLAVERLNAFVHEIGGDQDLRLIMGSRYRHCIAILNAGDETHARSTIERYASRANVDLCRLSYEAAPLHIS